MFKCPVCNKEYATISEVQKCVNACANKWETEHKAVLEKERKAEKKDKEENIKKKKANIIELTKKLQEFCDKYNTEVKFYNDEYGTSLPQLTVDLTEKLIYKGYNSLFKWWF